MPADTTTPPTDHIPADLFGGLLTGWIGPLRLNDGEAVVCIHAASDVGARVICQDGVARNYTTRSLRLPIATRPEARWQVARVLAAGEPPCRCGRSAATDEGKDPAKIERCNACWSKVFRKPAPIWWALPQSEGGSLPNDRAAWSAGLIACSARRVAVGLGVVVGVLSMWDAIGTGRFGRRSLYGALVGNLICDVGDARARTWMPGWKVLVRPGEASGPETGPAGKSAADAAALAAGFALANDDGTLVLPWPEGVRDAL